MRSSTRWGCAVALALLAVPARADDKRPLPDYSGRPQPTTAGEASLWGPRVLLAPAWAAYTYLVRLPLRLLVKTFDRDAAEVASISSPGTRWTLRPLVTADLGFRPRFGAHVVFDPQPGLGPFRARAEAGAAGFALGGSQGFVIMRDRAVVAARAEIDRRDDAIFHGLGPASGDERLRISVRRADAQLATFARPLEGVEVIAAIGGRGASLVTPAPIAEDWIAMVERVAVALDTRARTEDPSLLRPPPRWSNGVRLAVDAEHATAPSPARSWIAYGASALLHLNVTRERRVVELGAVARFVDPLSGEAPPPLLSLVSLGGPTMRGFLEGRLRGRSAFVASATYRWPVWIWLDGFVGVEAGNAFDAHLDGLRPGLLRLSAVTGVRNHLTSSYRFEVMTGFGTEPFDQGARPTSFRLLFAATRPL